MSNYDKNFLNQKYKELKKELMNDGYFFETNSDTEVFLAFILAKGINSINKVNGIFGLLVIAAE